MRVAIIGAGPAGLLVGVPWRAEATMSSQWTATPAHRVRDAGPGAG